jgi:KipI family sensor histidine kinase inhibitor
VDESVEKPTVREAGDSALLVELGDRIDRAINEHAILMAARVREEKLPGVRDVVATIRSVAVFFDPLETDVEALNGAIQVAATAPGVFEPGATVEVPVVYGGDAGPDLDVVAAWAGLPKKEVISRHAAPNYRVFMMGFLPGFAYLGTVDPLIAAPRRSRPRLRVPAGSVGIAGLQTGVYPSDGPGGWSLVGRSKFRMFDPARSFASMLAPGDTVRFVPVGGEFESEPTVTPLPVIARQSTRHVTVVHPGMFTTVQDLGRWGYQERGVSVAGAMDGDACRRANLAVGNDPGAAVLEVTLIGPEIRVEAEGRVAVSGADLSPTLDGEGIPRDTATAVTVGNVVRFGEHRAGARAYLAFDGGVDVPLVLGSRSTHVRSALGGIGGRPLAAGDRVPLGRSTTTAQVDVAAPPLPVGGARLRIVPGPQLATFRGGALDLLSRTRFRISTQSDRMGYRLEGSSLPGPSLGGTMISDASFPGAVQVPPSGEPILLMADCPTTGGYPQIGVVATADIGLAAQLAPGDWVEFIPCSRREAIAALVAARQHHRA